MQTAKELQIQLQAIGMQNAFCMSEGQKQYWYEVAMDLERKIIAQTEIEKQEFIKLSQEHN